MRRHTEGGLAATRDETPGGKTRRGARRYEEDGPSCHCHPDRADPLRQGSRQLHRQGRPRPDLRAPLDAPGVHPYDEITWELRSAEITNESGKTVFEQKDIEVPAFWSQLATNVVVSKYFRGHIGTPGRERSVKQLIDRVVNTIAAWAADAALLRAPTRTWPPSRRS